MTAVIAIIITWTLGEFIFLGIFFAILAIIVITLGMSALRTFRVMREHKMDEVRWTSEFHDLPERSRTCRHEFTGEFKHRVCDNEFDCNACATHAKLLARKPAEASAPTVQTAAGFAVPLDRLYHRGHTWVKPEDDGTFTIGIDDFASRLIGTPDRIDCPPIGSHLSVNGSAWDLVKGETTTRFLSPIDGEVVATSSGEDGWIMRVKPEHADVRTGHLLRGREVGAWIDSEFDRLQKFVTDPEVGITMPDGGMAVKDIAGAYPNKNWEAVYAQIFLEP